MGLIVVLLIIASVIWSQSLISAICIILFCCIIIVEKQLQKWFLIFIAAFFIPFYFYSTFDYKREVKPFDFELKETKKAQFRFSDDLKVDGNLLMGALTFNEVDYQFFYMIGSASEKEYLANENLSFLNCSGQIKKQHVLPNTNFSGFHYDAFLFRAHKEGSVKLSNIDWQRCQKSTLNFIERIKDYRQSLVQLIKQSDIAQKGYFIALTLGDTSYLNKEEMNVLKTLGIYHLYAISGSHVALISVQLYYLLRRIHVPLIICKSFLCIILPMYMIFTGGQPSVFRCTIFILIVLLNPAHKTQMIDLLSLTFIINLLYDPFALYDIGFQLSYIICYSFILVLPLYIEQSNLFQFFLINLISQCVTIPILFYHFNSNYLIGIITNIFYIPLFTFIIFPICTLGLIMLMLNLHLPFITYLINTSFLLNDMLTAVFKKISRFEVILGQQHIIVYIIMFVVLMLCFSQQLLIRITSITLLCLFPIVSYKAPNDKVHFLDVGQGDAFILELGKETVMIDTGGKLDFSQPWEKRQNAQNISDKVTIPFLKHRGISKINTLILTHPDADHFGETEYLLKADMVEKIILNPKAHGSVKYQDIMKLGQEKGVTLLDVNAFINTDQSHFNQFVQSLHHQATLKFLTVGQTGEENDDSIVVFLKYQKPGRNILFLADLSKDYEDEILNQINEPIDIVKIGHHGSRTSTSEALLKREPKLGIISAGRHNRFEHPHRETMEALNQSGIKALNTQTDGRITVDLETGQVNTQYQSLFLDK